MFIKIYQRKYHVLELLTRISCALVLFYWIVPYRFASHYEYLREDEIYEALVEHVTRNISLQQLEDCDYKEVIAQNRYMYKAQYRERVLRSEEIRPGGEYFPEDCRAKFSTAIIVPYRQREKQLNDFLIYMHNYLRQQKIHYRIFLVEQYDKKPFNRAKLFNIGSLIAAQHEFPCIVLHDVDLMPLNSGQLYACTEQPRHMCSALDCFRFNLPYTGLFGGVVGIRVEQFRFINGMSNMYQGWGGEDDDFYERLEARKLSICRFEPAFSEYTMLKHRKEKPNEFRNAMLQSGPLRFHSDGLNTLIYKEKETRIHSLFTHILVET